MKRYKTLQAAFLVASLSLASIASAGDWVHWRGPKLNGTSPETGLPSSWSQKGENLLWTAPVGVRSTPLIHNGRVFAISKIGEGEHRQERVVALDLATGKIVWEHRFDVFLTDVVFHRLGWANIAVDPETGNVYAHGVQGLLFCFDRDGKILWQRSLTEEFGRISGYGGRTYSPIIEGDYLIIGSITSGWGPQGKGAHRFFGMNKRTGEIRWIAEAGGQPLNTAYSVPVVTTMDGGRVMFTGLADGTIAAMRPTTGEVLWTTPISKEAVFTSVIYDDGKVYAVHGATNVDSGTLGRLVCLDARTGKEIWRQDSLSGQYASPLLHEGLLYVPTTAGFLVCVDAKDGKIYWEHDYGNDAKGSPVWADGKIYAGDVPGRWVIMEANKAGCKTLDDEVFIEESGAPDEVYATAAVADGKVVLSTLTAMYCISTKKADFKSAPAPIVLGPGSDLKAGPTATMQLEPAEIFLSPGEKHTFTLQGFDAKGNPTGPVPADQVTFSLERLQGEVSKDGVYTAAGARIQGGTVVAKVGEKSFSSRVRVFPPLPYAEDFEKIPVDMPPAGWITSKTKSVVSDEAGNKVLRKLADNPAPPFASMRCFIYPPLPSGYTIQSDMLGQLKKKWLPDMGLINSRYSLVMAGTSERTRKLQLASWNALPRIAKEIDFPWEGDKWYTVKLSVDLKDGKAIVRGKVWPKDTAEPEAWSIEMIDPCPNDGGSPGLYATATAITSTSKGTEILFDNVKITPNTK